jgi:hypothetical protein
MAIIIRNILDFELKKVLRFAPGRPDLASFALTIRQEAAEEGVTWVFPEWR